VRRQAVEKAPGEKDWARGLSFVRQATVVHSKTKKSLAGRGAGRGPGGPPHHSYGRFKFQRPLSLLGSNFAKVGVLAPTAVSAIGSFEPGTDFGIMRYVPSVN